MSVLCLGPKNAGKTHLLCRLQQPQSINCNSHSVPTVGSNLYTISTTKRKTDNRSVSVREVGGTMASLWHNYLANVNKIMFVVDTSNLCQIAAAGVLFYSLLTEPRLQGAKILIVLSKMDLAYRQMRNEALLMLQMDKLRTQIRQTVTIIEASALNEMGHEHILDWLSY